VLADDAIAARARVALEHNLWSLWGCFGRGHDCRSYEDGGVHWFDTPIPERPYNGAYRCDPDAGTGAIERLVRHYAARGVPFTWIVHPSAAEAGLEAHLLRAGFTLSARFHGMYRRLANLPVPPAIPADVTLREVCDAEARRAFHALVAFRWGLPASSAARLPAVTSACQLGASGSATRCWLAWRGGRAVAKVVLHTHDHVAGLYGVVTLPEARGLGLARALTLCALAEARRHGCTMSVLHSSAMARAMYLAMGYQEGAGFSFFASPET